MAFMFGTNFFSAFSRFATSQAFEDLLSKEDTTIEQVLEEEDVIQETRNSNPKLMEFLTEERIESMLIFITEEPPEDADHNRAYKFPFTVSEILSCEQPSIMDKITSSSALLERIFKFFMNEDALNLTLAGYVGKCVTSLITRGRGVIAAYILEDNIFSKALVRHIYSKSISELVSRILSMEEQGSEPVFIPERADILDDVIKTLGKSDDQDAITNATVVLVEFIQRNEGVSGWNLLIARFLSRDILTKVFGYLTSGNATTVKGVVTVLNAVFNHNLFSDIIRFDFEKLAAGEEDQLDAEDEVLLEEESPVLVEVLIENIPKLSELLQKETGFTQPMTHGEAIAPVGETRLRLIELITAAIKTDSDLIHKAIFESKILLTMTDLFFSHVWNSSLHYYYNETVQKILSLDQVYLRNHLVQTAQLPAKIIAEIKDCNATAGGRYYRKGNLGYVTKIANQLVRTYSGESEELCEGWEAFVKNELYTTNELENRNIGGYKPYSISNDDPSDSGYNEKDNWDRFSSHFTNDDEEVEEDIEEDFERGEPLSLDDLENSPEKTEPKIPINLDDYDANKTNFKERAVFRPGTPMVTSMDLLCMSTESLNFSSMGDESEYNANAFWKPDIIDIDELEELD